MSLNTDQCISKPFAHVLLTSDSSAYIFCATSRANTASRQTGSYKCVTKYILGCQEEVGEQGEE